MSSNGIRTKALTLLHREFGMLNADTIASPEPQRFASFETRKVPGKLAISGPKVHTPCRTDALNGPGIAAPILTLTRRRFRCEVQQLRGSDQSSFEKEFLGNSLERSSPYLYRSTL